MPKSILIAAGQCAQLLVPTTPLSSDFSPELETQRSRLKIWAGNLGVFAPGTASADHRLRDDPDIKDVLVSILTRLADTVQQLLEPPASHAIVTEATQANIGADGRLSSASSSSSLALSSESDSGEEEGSESGGPKNDNRDEKLQRIDGMISRLYRLSYMIRKPVRANERERVLRFFEEQNSPLDFSELETYVRWQLKNKCPRLEVFPTLADRLVSAAIYRRKKLVYRQIHQRKLEQGTEECFIPRPNSSDENIQQGLVLAGTPENDQRLADDKPSRKGKNAVSFINTKASALNRPSKSSYAKSAILSGITASAVARRDQLDVPPPPKPTVAGLEEAVCPYCCRIVGPEVIGGGRLQQARWTRHVLKDIEPYVCLFEDCKIPFEQFQTVEEWIDHMKLQHTMVWSCQAAGHGLDFFKTLEQLEDHLRHVHPDSFEEFQLQTVVQNSAKPAPDTFAALAAHIPQNTSGFPNALAICPLCSDIDQPSEIHLEDSTVTSFPEDLYKDIRDHLAAHLEWISLLSLPERDDVDDDISDELQSAIQGADTGSEDGDLPSASYDDYYEFSLKQIEMQGTIQREKAFKVLSWLSFAMGPLTVKALQQALSVESGDAELDEDKQPPLDDLVSVCRGLVVVDSVNDTQNIRLVHESTRNYLKNLRYANFRPGHEIILKACLAYLSLREFRSLCGYQIRAEERSRKYPFLGYAAKYWPEHAIQGNLESRFQDLIVSFLESSQRHSADELMAMRRPSAWGAENATPWTDWNRLSIHRRDSPFHAAATYGLRKTIRLLLAEKGHNIGRRNNFGETALHRAAQVSQTGAMEVLIAHGADLHAKVYHHYLNEATPIILAANCRQVDAVRQLLNHGVDVNVFDAKFGTFPLHLAASMDTEMTQLLLDQGALVNFPGKSPLFPETWLMTSLHFAVFFSHRHEGALNRVNLLLDRGANINAQSSLGNTALHMAILSGYGDLTRVLLQKGADIYLQNKQAKSALQLAKEGGYFRSVEDAISPEIFHELQKAPVLCTAIWFKNHSHVREMLEMGCDIELEDQHGKKPWDYCILSSDVKLAQILVDYMIKQNLPKHIGNAAFETAITHMTTFDYTDHKTWEDTVQICRLLLTAFDGNLDFATARSPIHGYNRTFLIWAAELGRISEAEFFLDCGSDVNASDIFGITGLQCAVNNKNLKMVELLVERGANLRLQDREGYTILQRADMSDNLPVKAYLEAYSKDKDGQTPLSRAAAAGHETVERNVRMRSSGSLDLFSVTKSRTENF